MQQTFDTTAGVTYLVDYSLITQQGTAAQANTVAAYNGANLLASVDNSIQNTTWFSGTSLSFVATGPSTTLIFTDTTIPANVSLANWGLDGVSVTAVTPEPASACLLLGGAVALLLRRRL